MNKRLDELRDKMAILYSRNYPRRAGHTNSFKNGFDAAIAELMPRVERLVRALEFYGELGHWGIDMPARRTAIDPVDQEEIQVIAETRDGKNNGFLDVRGGKRARETLTEWREFMGEG